MAPLTTLISIKKGSSSTISKIGEEICYNYLISFQMVHKEEDCSTWESIPDKVEDCPDTSETPMNKRKRIEYFIIINFIFGLS